MPSCLFAVSNSFAEAAVAAVLLTGSVGLAAQRSGFPIAPHVWHGPGAYYTQYDTGAAKFGNVEMCDVSVAAERQYSVERATLDHDLAKCPRPQVQVLQVLPNVQVASIQGVPSTKSRTAVPWTHTYNGYQDTPHLHMRGMTHPTRHSPPPIYCAPCVARILHTSPSHTDCSRFYSIAFVLGNRHTMPFARMATRKRACASVASAAHATSCRRPSFVTPFSEAFSARSRWRS